MLIDYTRFRGFSEDWAIAFIHNIRLVLYVLFIQKCKHITNQHIAIFFMKALHLDTEVGQHRIHQ